MKKNKNLILKENPQRFFGLSIAIHLFLGVHEGFSLYRKSLYGPPKRKSGTSEHDVSSTFGILIRKADHNNKNSWIRWVYVPVLLASKHII
jgi:hypothetical protein